MLCRLTHRRVIVDDISGYLHSSFLNIGFHKNSPAILVFTLYAGEFSVILKPSKISHLPKKSRMKLNRYPNIPFLQYQANDKGNELSNYSRPPDKAVSQQGRCQKNTQCFYYNSPAERYDIRFSGLFCTVKVGSVYQVIRHKNKRNRKYRQRSFCRFHKYRIRIKQLNNLCVKYEQQSSEHEQ